MKLAQQIAMFLLLIGCALPSRATMIVVLYTKDGYWIAADSERSKGPEHIASVCKIHDTHFGLIVKIGDVTGTRLNGDTYSTDTAVHKVVDAAPNAETLKTILRSDFKKDIQEELAYLVDEPAISGSNLPEQRLRYPLSPTLIESLARSLLFFERNEPQRLGEFLLVKPQSDPIGDYYRYWAPATYGWHPIKDIWMDPLPPAPQLHGGPSIKQFGYVVTYSRSEDWIQMHPEEALHELLEKGHTEDPHRVAPPYSIVHVILKPGIPPRVRWVARGQCPGWTETSSTDDFLSTMRSRGRAEQFFRPYPWSIYPAK